MNEHSVNYISLLEDWLDRSIPSLTVSKKEEKYRDNQKPHLPHKTGLDAVQSHPLRRTHFTQYQASLAALGWLGNGDCYLMHRMQPGLCERDLLCTAANMVEALAVYALPEKLLYSHSHGNKLSHFNAPGNEYSLWMSIYSFCLAYCTSATIPTWKAYQLSDTHS